MTGGAIERVRRIGTVRNQRWELTVSPQGDAAVTLTLKETSSCTDAHAVCTADGRTLDGGATATVAGPATVATEQPGAAFTGAFANAPGEHDGETVFTLEFSLSEAPRGLGWRTVKGHLFDVTGGAIERVRRIGAVRNRGWELTVAPDGNAAVSLTLRGTASCTGAHHVCTADGRMLEGGVRMTIAGPAALSVADAEVDEAEGATLDFTVTLSRGRDTVTSVAYATTNGTATAGNDYTATSGTLTFAALETTKTVSVPILNDAHDEGEETLTFTLSSASGARIADDSATGTIKNSDHMPRAWMLRFGRAVGAQVVDALGARFAGANASHITLGGLRFDPDTALSHSVDSETPRAHPVANPNAALSDTARAHTLRTMTMDDLIRGGAFHLSTAGPGGGALSAWGRVAHERFDADVDDVALEGRMMSALFGVDAQWHDIIAGVALSRSSGDGDYRLAETAGDDEGTVDSALTGLYPYVRLDLTERVALWGTLGIGAGALTLERAQGETLETDLSMRMGAIGATGTVLDGSGATGLTVNLKSDALWVAMDSDATQGLIATEGETHRLRLVVEGERTFSLNASATLTPSAEMGLRLDGGDAETGAGLEIGAGLRYGAGRLSIEARARTLVAHEESGYEEWGASGAIRWRSRDSGRGLSLSLSPAWGSTGSAAERLWSARDARALGFAGEFEGRGRLDGELGYGVALSHRRGLLTPYAALSLSGDGERTLRTGARWALDAHTSVSLDGEHARTSESATSALSLRGELRF